MGRAPENGSGRAGGAGTIVSSERLAVSVWQRLRESRWSVVFYLIVIATPVLVGAASVGAYRLTAAPQIRLNFGSFSGRVTQIFGDWPGVKKGDRIVQINDARVDADPVRIRRALLGLQPGTATITFSREGTQHSVTTATHPLRTWRTVGVWTRVATGMIILLIGIIAFVMRPGTRVAWLFLLFSTALATHLLSYMALIDRPSTGLVLETTGEYLAGAFGIHLFSVFPRDLASRRRWLFPVMYGLVAIAIVPPFLHGYAATRSIAVASVLFVSIWAALASLVAIGLVVVQFLRAKSSQPIVRARAFAVLVGVVLGLALPAALGVVASRYQLGWVTASSLVIVFALLTAWSIVRHNALEVDRFTAAVLGYACTTAGLVTLFGLLLVGVTTLVGTTGVLRSPITSVMTTAAFFLAFNPVYRKVRRRVDRLFGREALEEDVVLGLLHDLAQSVRTAKLATVYKKGLEAAQSLGADAAELWMKARSGFFEPKHSTGSVDPEAVRDPVGPNDALVQAVREGSGGVDNLVDLGFDDQAQAELWARGFAFAAPVFVWEELRAFVAVSRKTSGAAFNRRERALLDTIASHLGIAIEHNEAEQNRRFGPYRTIRRLGAGGMAEVYLAEKTGPGGFVLHVALKRLLPHLAEDPDAVKMVLDEARIAAHLNHPNIVRIFDVSQHDGRYWLAMELLDGPHLGRMVDWARSEHSLLPLPVVSAVAHAVLGALGHAHAARDAEDQPMRVVHRDVKPGNILTNRQGAIKLADFGIARAESRLYETQTGVVRGTPAYMAPEQRAGRKVGPAADLWATGAVLYEVLTGVSIPPDPSAREKLDPPSTVVPSLPVALDAVIARAMATDPGQRFDSAEDMLAAFDDALGDITPASAADMVQLIGQIDHTLAPPKQVAADVQASTISLKPAD